jgi:hypothetical protein
VTGWDVFDDFRKFEERKLKLREYNTKHAR